MKRNALTIKNLQKTYASGHQALQGINLSVEEGEFFALLGPNGAGKSTAIGIISSLVNKTSGTVEVFGHDLDKARTTVKTYLGLVPQEFNFNQFEKVEDIVVNQAGFYGIPKKIALARAKYYLEKLGLWDKRAVASRTLSGGMKRRLMIARALIHSPKILILDEPTAGVDIELRRAMWDFLQEINKQGTTIILTTHYLEEAEFLCRGIAIIDEGKIIENTTIKKLLNRLTTETMVLDVREKIQQVPVIAECMLKMIDDNSLEITFSKHKNLNEIFAMLTKHDITVLSMRNKTNRLEELFLHMVHKNSIQ